MTRESKPIDDHTEQVARIFLEEIYGHTVSDDVCLKDTKNPKGVHAYQVARLVMDKLGDLL